MQTRATLEPSHVAPYIEDYVMNGWWCLDLYFNEELKNPLVLTGDSAGTKLVIVIVLHIGLTGRKNDHSVEVMAQAVLESNNEVGGDLYKTVSLQLSTVMVDPWWSLLGAAIPVVVAGQALRMRKKRAEEQSLKAAGGRDKSSDEIFVCERVCTSKRMLNKVGAFSKDPIFDTCVTVCGVSSVDACADACARTVCVNQHQVPNWNDICLRRCQSECLKLSNSSVTP
ncbi:hypothetical protein ACFE04_025611 [Oxalis oulophora]